MFNGITKALSDLFKKEKREGILYFYFRYLVQYKKWVYSYIITYSKKTSVRSILKVSIGNSLAAAIGIIGTMVQARLVGPVDLGYLRQFGIISSYAFFLHLGIWHALQRLYPLYLGEGKRDRALAVAQICQSWNIGIATFISGVFTIMAFIEMINGNWRASLAWCVQIVAMMYNFYGGYLNATYRSGRDFQTASKSSIISSITALFSLPFFLIWPYIGMILRSTIGSIASLLYLHRNRPLKLAWRFNWREWYNLLKEGLPLFTASYVVGMGWYAVEATLVVTFYNTTALGLWSISIMFFEMAKIMPQTIVAIYIPKLMYHFGQNKNTRDSLYYCKKPMFFGMLGTLGVLVILYFVLPLAIQILAPKYVDAISTMRLVMLQLPILILEIPLTILIAKGDTLQQNISSISGLLIFSILAFINYRLGFSFNGIIIASCIGRICRIVISYCFIYLTSFKESNIN